jgi:hypothetical protein
MRGTKEEGRMGRGMLCDNEMARFGTIIVGSHFWCLILPAFQPEDGDCDEHHNVGTTSTYDAAKPRNPKLHDALLFMN